MANKSNLHIYETLEPHLSPMQRDIRLIICFKIQELPDAYRRIGRRQLDAWHIVEAYRRISKSIEGTYNRLQR